MKVDTVLKFGSLAFGVAQDERLRELFKIAHNGAKRRGWLPPAGSQSGQQPYIPFTAQHRPQGERRG